MLVGEQAFFVFIVLILYYCIMEEIWKDIEGYEEMYQVSNLGRVKGLERTIIRKDGKPLTIEEQILKPSLDSRGYYFVSLTKNKQPKNYRIHRLIAEAFIPNPDNKPEIDHINTVPTDNRIENLRWVTHKENMNNQTTISKMSNSQQGKHLTQETKEKISKSLKDNPSKPWLGKFGNEHPNSKPILQFTKDGDFMRKWECFSEIERNLGINHSNILKVIKGIRNHTGGYKWGYAEDYERISFKVFDLEIYRKKVA